MPTAMMQQPEPERSQKVNVQKAQQFSDEMLLNIGTGEWHYVPTRQEIHAVDVASAMAKLDIQLFFCNRARVGFPCVLSENRNNPIPVQFVPDDISQQGGSKNLQKVGLWHERFWREVSDAPGRTYAGLRVEEYDTASVTSFVRSRLINFLAARFGAPPNLPDYPGLQVTVTTQSMGLRVHYSPVYLFNPASILNAPTSPVKGSVRPGRYVFGVSRPGGQVMFDSTAEYDIPPIDSISMGF